MRKVTARSLLAALLCVLFSVMCLTACTGSTALPEPDPCEPTDFVLEPEKPIIYLYPTETTEVTVVLGAPERLTCTYPKYEDAWQVLANPNGDLTDLSTNRQLYALYYESVSDRAFGMEQEGFVVKREDTAAFLEEKLAVLGLTEREAQEFIIYWLPRLEANPYTYIRFATPDEIAQSMPLHITPAPDTTIRVLMTFQGLKTPVSVREQTLETPVRTGFVAVEWGGVELG